MSKRNAWHKPVNRTNLEQRCVVLLKLFIEARQGNHEQAKQQNKDHAYDDQGVDWNVASVGFD